MKIHKWAGVSGAALLFGLGLAQGVQAQAVAVETAAVEADTEVEEVTITARRRSERLQNVPLAVSAVRGSELATQQLDRVADYQFKVPNFGAVQQNPRVSTLTIRGIGGNASNDGAESGVGLIVDNVFYTHVGFAWLDFVDLDSIEVVRGPQGTLLGKNTTVGALIIKTKEPSFTPELSVEGTYASRERKQVRISSTGPLIEDKLAYRLTASTDNGGGWVKNAWNGDDYLDNNRFGLRGQLLFTPTANISNRLILEHTESKEFNNFYPPVTDVNFNYNLDGSVHSPRTSWEAKLKGLFGYTPSYDAPNNADLNNQQRIVSKTDGASNELNWDFSGLTLTSITAWRKFYFRPYNDSDYSPLRVLRGGYDVDAEQYSQEFRLANTTGGVFDWQVGAFYLKQEVISDNRTILYEDASRFLAGAALPSIVLNGVTYSKLGSTEAESVAIFGQGTWHITDRFDLTLGLRYTEESRDARVVGSYSGGAALPPALAPYRAAVIGQLAGTSGAGGTAAAGIFNISDSKDSDSVSWIINPSYKLNDNVLLYAHASYGEKSGAANTTAIPVSPTFTHPLIIEPEKSTDYEVGFKSTFAANRATVNLNFYHNTIEDYQAAQRAQEGLTLTTYLGNVGEVRLQGVELETRFRFTPEFSASLNAAYNDAKYTSYDNAPAPVEYEVALNYQPLSQTGDQLNGIPKVNVQLSLDYERSVGGNLNFFAYGNTLYRSEVSFLGERSLYGHQGSYSLTNAGIGLRTADQRYSVLLWSRNLFDEDYAIAYGTASAVNPVFAIQGEPRTVGLTFSGRF